MQIPAWAYVVGIVCVLPLYFLWGVMAYGILRALFTWIAMPEPAKPHPSTSANG